MCHEYRGPIEKYRRLGIKELWLPTVDHTEPTCDDLERAVTFIDETHKKTNGRVYVHCRAGHGRSAAVALAWMMHRQQQQQQQGTESVSLQEQHQRNDNCQHTTLTSTEAEQRRKLNQQLCRMRSVRSTLWKQPNIQEFHERLLSRLQQEDDDDDDNYILPPL